MHSLRRYLSYTGAHTLKQLFLDAVEVMELVQLCVDLMLACGNKSMSIEDITLSLILL